MKFIRIIAVLAILVNSGYSYSKGPIPTQTVIGASLLSFLVWNPMKLDGIGLDYGWDVDRPYDRAQMFWMWNFENTIKEYGPVRLEGHLELNFGQTLPAPGNVSVGLLPVMSWYLTKNPYIPHIETGLGTYYFSQTEHHNKQLSTHFQFGEMIGVANSIGPVEVGLRYQHHSNGNFKLPNNGYNFYGVTLRYWY